MGTGEESRGRQPFRRASLRRRPDLLPIRKRMLVLIEPSPEELKVVSSFKLPEPSGKENWPHPVIANGKLYIRDQDKLHCFNVKADKS